MGEVVSMAEFRRTRAAGAEREAAFGPIERLSAAVRRLETALGETEHFDDPDVRRELLAVNGAVAVGRYGAAAARAERLIQRLRA
ncbi:MAG TPA: hypothetical protein VNN79_23400 [Actinomycetota bacterium]|nr:hypothetical protein [Actinomycetota bacterium]